jgi:hypothetical protein
MRCSDDLVMVLRSAESSDGSIGSGIRGDIAQPGKKIRPLAPLMPKDF